MRKALLVIDVQKDYFPGGRMELVGSVETSKRIRGLISLFRKRKNQVIHVQYIAAKPNASFFLPDTDGVDFHENVLPEDTGKIIREKLSQQLQDYGSGRLL